MKRFALVLSITSICLICTLAPRPLFADDGVLIESLGFRLKWGPFHVGYGTLQTRRLGSGQVRYTMTARSNAFVDLFYAIRQKIESISDPVAGAVSYEKYVSQGGEERRFSVRFERVGYAFYESADGAMYEIELSPGAMDPLSVLYEMRKSPLKKGVRLRRPACDGRRQNTVYAVVHDRQPIKYNGQTLDTFVVDVEMYGLDGILSMPATEHYRIWLTADENRIPIRIRARAVIGPYIGMVTADLDYAEQNQQQLLTHYNH